MPKKAVVTIRYGPYSAVGLAVEHRTFRLEGLQGGSLPRAPRSSFLSCSRRISRSLELGSKSGSKESPS